MYAITITTKHPDIKLIHDVFKLECEKFMKQQYKNRKYNLFYECGEVTGYHAHGTIDTHFLPKNNKNNLFYVYIKPIDEAYIWDAYTQKEVKVKTMYQPNPFLDDN